MWSRQRLLHPVLHFCGGDLFYAGTKRSCRHHWTEISGTWRKLFVKVIYRIAAGAKKMIWEGPLGLPDAIIPKRHHIFHVKLLQGLESVRYEEGSIVFKKVSRLACQVLNSILNQAAGSWLCAHSGADKQIEEHTAGSRSCGIPYQAFWLRHHHYLLLKDAGVWTFISTLKQNREALWAHHGCGTKYDQQVSKYDVWDCNWPQSGWEPHLDCASTILQHAIH